MVRVFLLHLLKQQNLTTMIPQNIPLKLLIPEYFFRFIFFVLLFPYKAVVLIIDYYITIKMMYELRKSWYQELKQNVNEYQTNHDELKKKLFIASYEYMNQSIIIKFKENVWFKWIFSFLVYSIVIYKYFLAN